LAVNFLDYLSVHNRGVVHGRSLTTDTMGFIARLEESLGVPVGYGGVSPAVNETLVFSKGSQDDGTTDASGYRHRSEEFAQR